MNNVHTCVWELFDRYCFCPYLIDTLVERGVTEEVRLGSWGSTSCLVAVGNSFSPYVSRFLPPDKYECTEFTGLF